MKKRVAVISDYPKLNGYPSHIVYAPSLCEGAYTINYGNAVNRFFIVIATESRTTSADTSTGSLMVLPFF